MKAKLKPLNPSNGSYVPPTSPAPPPCPFITDMKPILTKQKNSDLYLKNFMQLGEALMNAGGNSFLILKKYDDFLRTLASNNIEVTAKYNYPEETAPLKTTGENEMIFFDEVDQRMTEDDWNSFGEYHLSPKNLEWFKQKDKAQEELQKKLVKHMIQCGKNL